MKADLDERTVLLESILRININLATCKLTWDIRFQQFV